MSNPYVWRELFICVTRLVYMWVEQKPSQCFLKDSYVWHDSFICVTWLTWLVHVCDVTHLHVEQKRSTRDASTRIHMCGLTHSYVWRDARDSFIRVTWLISMWAESKPSRCKSQHSYVWHDSCICAAWLIWLVHVCDVTHFYVSRIEAFGMQVKGFIYATWLIHMCDVTHVTRSYVWRDSFLSYVWHDPFILVTWLTWFVHLCDVTHFYVSRIEAFAMQVGGLASTQHTHHTLHHTHAHAAPRA